MSILNAFLAAAGGGLEFEAGSFTPTSNQSSRTVNFSKTHAKPPAIAMCFDASELQPTTTRFGVWEVVDVHEIIRAGFRAQWLENWSLTTGGHITEVIAYPNGTYQSFYGGKKFVDLLNYGGTDTSQTGTNCTRYYMNESRLNITRSTASPDSAGAVLEANHKYVWIAIWLPDSWTQPT